MAAGIPTILSANTGHLDLIHMPMLKDHVFTSPRHPENFGIRHCYALWKAATFSDRAYWSQPFIWQIVDELERVQ